MNFHPRSQGVPVFSGAARLIQTPRNELLATFPRVFLLFVQGGFFPTAIIVVLLVLLSIIKVLAQLLSIVVVLAQPHGIYVL